MSHVPRIYYPNKLTIGDRVELGKEAVLHLRQVLRINDNDEIRLFNDKDGEFKAVVKFIDKKLYSIIGEKIIFNTESPAQIHLVQVISRGEKMDLTIQKATELGVNFVTPLFSERCNVILQNERIEKKLAHWKAVAINAAEQCGRCVIPEIYSAEHMSQWIIKSNQLFENTQKIILDPFVDNNLSQVIRGNSEVGQKTLILVGPEGGFSDNEIRLANDHGFISAKLGPRILRTETAGFIAIAIIQSIIGDLS